MGKSSETIPGATVALFDEILSESEDQIVSCLSKIEFYISSTIEYLPGCMAIFAIVGRHADNNRWKSTQFLGRYLSSSTNERLLNTVPESRHLYLLKCVDHNMDGMARDSISIRHSW